MPGIFSSLFRTLDDEFLALMQQIQSLLQLSLTGLSPFTASNNKPKQTVIRVKAWLKVLENCGVTSMGANTVISNISSNQESELVYKRLRNAYTGLLLYCVTTNDWRHKPIDKMPSGIGALESLPQHIMIMVKSRVKLVGESGAAESFNNQQQSQGPATFRFTVELGNNSSNLSGGHGTSGPSGPGSANNVSSLSNVSQTQSQTTTPRGINVHKAYAKHRLNNTNSNSNINNNHNVLPDNRLPEQQKIYQELLRKREESRIRKNQNMSNNNNNQQQSSSNLKPHNMHREKYEDEVAFLRQQEELQLQEAQQLLQVQQQQSKDLRQKYKTLSVNNKQYQQNFDNQPQQLPQCQTPGLQENAGESVEVKTLLPSDFSESNDSRNRLNSAQYNEVEEKFLSATDVSQTPSPQKNLKQKGYRFTPQATNDGGQGSGDKLGQGAVSRAIQQEQQQNQNQNLNNQNLNRFLIFSPTTQTGVNEKNPNNSKSSTTGLTVLTSGSGPPSKISRSKSNDTTFHPTTRRSRSGTRHKNNNMNDTTGGPGFVLNSQGRIVYQNQNINNDVNDSESHSHHDQQKSESQPNSNNTVVHVHRHDNKRIAELELRMRQLTAENRRLRLELQKSNLREKKLRELVHPKSALVFDEFVGERGSLTRDGRSSVRNFGSSSMNSYYSFNKKIANSYGTKSELDQQQYYQGPLDKNSQVLKNILLLGHQNENLDAKLNEETGLMSSNDIINNAMNIANDLNVNKDYEPGPDRVHREVNMALSRGEKNAQGPISEAEARSILLGKSQQQQYYTSVYDNKDFQQQSVPGPHPGHRGTESLKSPPQSTDQFLAYLDDFQTETRSLLNVKDGDLANDKKVSFLQPNTSNSQNQILNHSNLSINLSPKITQRQSHHHQLQNRSRSPQGFSDRPVQSHGGPNSLVSDSINMKNPNSLTTTLSPTARNALVERSPRALRSGAKDLSADVDTIIARSLEGMVDENIDFNQ